MYLTVYLCIRGFYPKGGGEVMVTVNPVKELTPVTMTERGNITKIYGRAYVAGVLPFKVKFTLTHITHFMVFTASTVVFLFFLCTGLFSSLSLICRYTISSLLFFLIIQSLLIN